MRRVIRFVCQCSLALLLAVQAWALPNSLVPVGQAVGIQLESDGVMVVGFSASSSAAAMAGIQKGDRICCVNGAEIAGSSDIQEAVAHCNGEFLTLTVLRGEETSQYAITPSKTQDGYSLGLLVRDGTAGIGTITFYDPETGRYGALGHGVSDYSGLIPLTGGLLTQATVAEVQPGRAGTPGALRGLYQSRQAIGTVEENLACGIFGHLDAAPEAEAAVPVADIREVQEGPAQILANVEADQVCSYDVEIVKVYASRKAEGKNLMLRVTDPELLDKTGGIVQGMSGSPILQNGKLIGAVTHVLVNDPTYGYGIFIETMLENS